MDKFKIGDRVEFIDESIFHNAKIGDRGEIVNTSKTSCGLAYGVKLDYRRDVFHNCAGSCENGYGQWVYENQIKLIEPEKKKFTVVIQSEGDCTTAKMLHGKKVIREAEVNRYFEDEYSEQVAIEAVVAKMFPLKEAKPELKADVNHKIQLLVCVDTYCSTFAITRNLHEGDIYTVIDGKIKKKGCIIYDGYTTTENLNAGTGCKFIEIYNSEGKENG